MSDDDVELTRLRERVYGTSDIPPTDEEISRLEALEEQIRVRRASAPPPAPPPRPAGPPPSPREPSRFSAPPALAPESSAPLTERRTDATPHPHRVMAVIAALTAAGALLGAGYAAGVGMPTSAGDSPTATPTLGAPYPELGFPQTDDDVIPARIVTDSNIDPTSTRYIAVMRGFRVFLAQRERGGGVCVVTLININDQPWSAGCTTGGPFDDGAVFGVDRSLNIALGDTSRMSIRGTPVRLSESVTAYVVE